MRRSTNALRFTLMTSSAVALALTTGCRSAIPPLIELFGKSSELGDRRWVLSAVGQIIRDEGDMAESPEAKWVAKQADCALILPVLTRPGPGAGEEAWCSADRRVR